MTYFLREPVEQPVKRDRQMRLLKSFAAPAFALMAGTGGHDTTEAYYEYVGNTLGYPEPLINASRTQSGSTFVFQAVTSADRQVATDLERVRSTFSSSMVELGGLFGVSRQAVYNWLKGELPSPENETRLRELTTAAQRLEDAGFATIPRLLKRNLGSQMTLFKASQSGRELKSYVDKLIAILQEEQKQRRILASRPLRAKVSVDAIRNEVGSPNLDESDS